MSGKKAVVRESIEVVLGIETGSGSAEIAMLMGNEVWRPEETENQVSRSEDILRQVRTGLAELGANLGQIRRIVVSDGPGSLTGLRIGKAIALGLGDSLGKTVSSVSAFDAMMCFSSDLNRKRNHFVLLSGGSFYASVSDDGGRSYIESHGRLDEFEKWVSKDLGRGGLVMLEKDWKVVTGRFPGLAKSLDGKVKSLSCSLAFLITEAFLLEGVASDNDRAL